MASNWNCILCKLIWGVLTLLFSFPITGQICITLKFEYGSFLFFCLILLWLIGNVVQFWNDWYSAHPGREAISFRSKAFCWILTVCRAFLALNPETRALSWEFSSLAGIQNLFLVLGQNSIKEMTLSFLLPKGIISQMPEWK